MAKMDLILQGLEGAEPDYQRLAALANERTAKARSERREIFDRNPALTIRLGDMAHHVEAGLVLRLSGNELLAETIPAKCRDMRVRLEYEGASELERLLIDRIIVTWLHVQRAELGREANTHGVSFAKAAFYHTDGSRALHDHTRAIIALARVRKLLRPNVAQVNIAANGGQQVNVA